MLNVDSDYAAPDGLRSLGGYTQADVRSKLVSTVHHTAARSNIFHTSPVAEYVGIDLDDCRNAIAIAAIIAALYHKSLMRDILHTVTASIPATPGVHYPVVVV